MIAEGLLWFDDDPRRPLAAKIASAVERYSERTGWAPTLCETHPSLVEQFTHEREIAAAKAERASRSAARRRKVEASAKPRARGAQAGSEAPALPARLRVTPNSTLRPNYFLVGVEAGARPRVAAGARPTARRRPESERVAPAPMRPVRTRQPKAAPQPATPLVEAPVLAPTALPSKPLETATRRRRRSALAETAVAASAAL